MEIDSANVRLIGGSHAGETVTWRFAQGPVIRLFGMTDCDFARPCDIDASLPQTVPIEEYHIEKLFYASGHRHYYGIYKPMRIVDAMNVMWNGYQDSLKSGN